MDERQIPYPVRADKVQYLTVRRWEEASDRNLSMLAALLAGEGTWKPSRPGSTSR